MKLRVLDKDLFKLTILTTGKEKKDFYFPKIRVYNWYPFNINFYYKYSDSKEFMYLVKEKGYEGENYYGVDILKRTKPLATMNGVPFHPGVYKRNKYIMEKARALGIPTLLDQYNLDDVEIGFNEIDHCMIAIREMAEDRYTNDVEDDFFRQFSPTEEYDELIYSYLTDEEQEAFTELGEMYSMLTVMIKLAEGN